MPGRMPPLYPCTLAILIAAGCAESRDAERPAVQRDEPAAVGTGTACDASRPAPTGDSRVVAAYFACSGGAPGQLYPVYRVAGDSVPAIDAALSELLRGPTDAERERGFRSYFGPPTAGALREIRSSPGADTIHVDLADLRELLPATPEVKSFLPPGVMAELTWTIFRQFPEVQAVRFSFAGSERAFWTWLGGPPEVFTRRDWEQI